MAKKLKVGDQIIVLTGKNKGQVGEVLSFEERGALGIYARVSGVNLRQRTTKADPQRGIEGGFKGINAPIHSSNIAIYNTETGKKDRVNFQTSPEGVKQRIYASNKKIIAKSKVN